jgi:outer membrane murein-binding lipoprotein Lpp
MGMSDYDLHIKDQDFRIAELISETAFEQLAARKAEIQIVELSIEIARLNAHIQTLETTLAAMSGELYALRMDTQ